MKVIKRNGQEVIFNAEKIKIAVSKANNSIDELSKRLSEEQINKIINQQIDELKNFLDKKGIKIEITQACCDLIADKGFSEEFGAREIARVIENEIKDKLIDIVLFRKEQNVKSIFCDVGDNSEIQINVSSGEER